MDPTSWALPVRRLERRPDATLEATAWPANVPAIAQVLTHGWDLGRATVLVGENGVGKSTLVEALAGAFGLDVRGGSANTRALHEDSRDPLERALRVVRGPGAARWGFFLRAETMHGVFGGIAGARDDPADFHAMSHGESFLALLATRRFADGGLYVLDEPESALSFTSCLSLVALLHDLAATGTAQVVVATHSPIIAALPGARVLAVDEDGLTETEWADVPLVAHWRYFLEDPGRYLRHVVD